jgi:ATP-dependent protease HslVU (ClpYQ) ATPase subunit|tara:strand:- start:29 stop:232 length:204 start_codon:yes stop_codon:yes gene_type:complete
MRNKNYAEKPLQVRLHTVQEDTLNKIMRDSDYCQRKNIISKSDAVRSALFSLCKDYEREQYNRLISK